MTVSLVPEARGGPFVFWDDFAAACGFAAELGFHAVELFPPAADAVVPGELQTALATHELELAAVGTGAGWVKHRLSLTAADAETRRRGVEFVKSIAQLAGEFGAATIIGSMQGRSSSEIDKNETLKSLADSLAELADFAAKHGSRLLFEPLNRYETDLVNTLAEGRRLLESSGASGLQLLADLFHMNIEETDLASAIRQNGSQVGHVHWVDSNRRAAGMGHLDLAPVAEALVAANYTGFISAEALPLPDSVTAAKQTIQSYHHHFAVPV